MGDLADVFLLIVSFASPARPPADAAITAADALVARHFDGIYLSGYGGGKVDFLGGEVQALMLEIWKVKFENPRFAEMIRSTR